MHSPEKQKKNNAAHRQSAENKRQQLLKWFVGMMQHGRWNEMEKHDENAKLSEKHRNIVTPTTRYWHDYCTYIGDFKRSVAQWYSLPDHLLVSFVYIDGECVVVLLMLPSYIFFCYLHFASFQSKPITMFSFAASILFSVPFLHWAASELEKRVHFSVVIVVMRFIGCICKWYGWSVAMTANDNNITAFNTLMD